LQRLGFPAEQSDDFDANLAENANAGGTVHTTVSNGYPVSQKTAIPLEIGPGFVAAAGGFQRGSGPAPT